MNIKRIAALATLIAAPLVTATTTHAELPDCKPGLTVIASMDDYTTCDLNPGDTLAALVTFDQIDAAKAEGYTVVVLLQMNGGTAAMAVGLDF